MEVIRISIAEDHHVTAEGIKSWFSKSSRFLVLNSCTKRDSVLPLINSDKPDVLLLDLHMPGDISLPELISAVSKAGVKIVVFSADNRPALVEQALMLGVQAFVLKTEPFSAVATIVDRVYRGEEAICPTPKKVSPVSPAEKEILSLLAKGLKYQEIARIRNTTSETIRKQCDKILMKLELPNREELIVWAIAQGYGQDIHS